MEKGDKHQFKNLLKSTRVLRAFPSLMILIVAMAFAGNSSSLLFVMAFCILLIYSASSIDNAAKDKDYELPKYYNKIIWAIFAVAIGISLVNKIILITVLLWILLGFIYNRYSRFIIFGDTTILSLTHYTLPLFSSLLILGADVYPSIKISAAIFCIFWFLTPIKNLKDADSDHRRGYKTLVTRFRKGKRITLCIFLFSLVLMAFLYIFIPLKIIYLLLLIPIFMSGFFVIRNVLIKGDNSLKLIRGIIVLFLSSLIISLSNETKFIVYAFILIFIYAFLLIVERKNV